MAKYSGLVVLLLALAGCEESDRSHVLPRYSGAPGEVLCVMNDALYEGRAGDILHEHLTAYQPLLPQGEPIFDLVKLNHSQVNNITRYHRNILFVYVSENLDEETRVEAQRNRWASEQMVISIYARTVDQLDSLMKENGPSIVQKFNEYERKRLQSNFQFKAHATLVDSLMPHELNLTLPRGSEIVAHEDNFVWIRRQRERNVSGTMHDILQGVLVYYRPYSSDSAFTQTQILQVRDSVLKRHVPGPSAGSYMTTEYLLPPVSEAFEWNGNYAVETRGLWKVAEGAPMGGPFISLSVLDEERQRVITAEGFVFAPKFNKREYLREVEAMIYSLDF